VKVYNPHDTPIVMGHDGTDYTLPANSDVELPDDVAYRALVRHTETGLRALHGIESLDVDIRKVAEEQYTLYLKRRLGIPSEASQDIYKSAQKRGLLPGPTPEPEPPAESKG